MSEHRRVIFLHLPKTGGTTLRVALERHYGADVTLNDRPRIDFPTRQTDEPAGGPAPFRDRNLDVVDRWRERGLSLERGELFMAHLRYGIHRHLPGPATYVTMVREPLARLRSYHRHMAAHRGEQRSLEAFLRDPRPVPDNFQVRAIAGNTERHVRGPCTPAMLDEAKGHLVDHFAGVGVTERYEESILAIGTGLGVGYLPHGWLNRGLGSIDDVPADLATQVRERNALDLELHRFADALLDEALAGRDVEADLRTLRRISWRLHARHRARDAVYPYRERVGRWRRSVHARARGRSD